MKNILKRAKEKALEGVGLTYDEGVEFTTLPDSEIFEVLPITTAIREHYKRNEVNLCSIVNAKSGLCKEDCTFCSQSVKYSTGVDTFPMVSPEEIVGAAKEAEASGANEFSIVASGTGIEKDGDIAKLTSALSTMSEDTNLEKCASLGILKEETLKKLKDAGLESYHHNLETSRSFFPEVCTTHEYDDDVDTIRRAKEMGFYVCSGGIFGLGESWEDRVEMGATLQELGVDSIPINFLNARPGTPLEGARELTPLKCLKIIALMRLMLPTRDILVCGGREVNMRDLQPLLFAAGANGLMLGNYLTTTGRSSEEDLKMIDDLGLTPSKGH